MTPPDLPDPAPSAGPAAVDVLVAPVLAAAVRAAASGGRLEATLHDIVAAAVRHVDAGYGAIGVLTPDGRRLDRFVIVGMGPDDRERIGRLPTGRGILGLLIAEPAALRLDDLGGHPGSVGFPPGHPPMRSFLGVPLRVGEAVFGNLYLTEKRTGGSFTEADVEIVQALAAVAGMAIENAQHAERADTRRRWGQAARELATALLSGADPDDVFRVVCDQVAELTSADMAGVLAPSHDHDGSLTVVTAVGVSAGDYEGVRLPLTGTYLGALYEAGQPRAMEDISTMPVMGRRAAVVVELTAVFGPGMIVPLGNGPGRGLLAVLRLAGREPFTAEELDLLADFATQAAVVLELARAQQRERRLQVQADRDRIARDLHDHVVQRIFATALSLDRLGRTLEPEHADVAARLARSVDELDGTMAEIRTAIFELHEQEAAGAANSRHRLADVVHRVTEGQTLQRDVRFRGPIDELPHELLPELVAVVRELVTNVVRHASATRATVTVTVGVEVSVAVVDDGLGLPPVTVRSGLANLAERAERRGGRLTISTGPSGTEVCWAVPRPAER
ncbi:MAG TPA: GAF domain-containing protein [Blastococcus sp.]|nr:GAF domain-containing protein [Blastococcus sp.]